MSRRGDLDGLPEVLRDRDPEFIRRTLPVWGLLPRYFRADIQGLGHIPADGPVLLVGNHSGGKCRPTPSC